MEQSQVQEETDFEIDASAVKLNELRKKQKPMLGIPVGVLATVAVTALWILMSSKYKLSWMCVGAAVGIAFSIQYTAKAVDLWYGIVGAFLSLVSSITGNLFTAVFLVSNHKNIPASEVWAGMSVSKALTYLNALAQPFDYLMYLGAIFAGFYFSFKHIKQEPTN